MVRNVDKVHPIVLSRGEHLVDPHSNAHSQEVAAEHIRDHFVPPALLEVG